MKDSNIRFILEEFLGKEHENEIDFEKGGGLLEINDLVLLSDLYDYRDAIVGGAPDDPEVKEQEGDLFFIELRIKNILKESTLASLVLVLDELFKKTRTWALERIIELLEHNEPTYAEVVKILDFYEENNEVSRVMIEKIKAISVEDIPEWFIVFLSNPDPEDSFFFARAIFRQKAEELYEALKNEE